MARWRTLHEIAAVAFFLKEYGEDTARRYIEHEAIEADNAARDYDNCCDRLGYEPLTDGERAEIQSTKEKVVERYGRNFKTSYGWAAHALGMDRPMLSHIERASGIDHLRAHYRMASHPVHANPKGILFKLGLLHNEKDVILTGPSDAGLADPGQCSAISLYQVTTALGLLKPSLDNFVVLRILNLLIDETQEAFHEANKTLEQDAS
jgi:hypothetical protein